MRIIIEGSENDRETAEVLQRIASAIVKENPASPPPELLETAAKFGAVSAGPAAFETPDLTATPESPRALEKVSPELKMDAGAAAAGLESTKPKPRATAKKRTKRTTKPLKGR